MTKYRRFDLSAFFKIAALFLTLCISRFLNQCFIWAPRLYFVLQSNKNSFFALRSGGSLLFPDSYCRVTVQSFLTQVHMLVYLIRVYCLCVLLTIIPLIISACNQTYHVETGESGRLNIPRPRGDKLPFTCWIQLVSTPGNRMQVSSSIVIPRRVRREWKTEYPPA
jgi:hypothetical protein